jgi:Fe-S cluster biogenesis protein NfuA
MLDKINRVIETSIRPDLLNHYGDIEVVSYNDGLLRVRLLGQCKNCPSAQITLEETVSSKLKESVPEIKKVVLQSDVSEELYDFAKKILKIEK